MTEPQHLNLKPGFDVKIRTEGNNFEGNKARLQMIVKGKADKKGSSSSIVNKFL